MFPFVAQAAATSTRVPRAGIVVPLRRKRTGCGRVCVRSRTSFVTLVTSASDGRAGVVWAGLSFFFETRKVPVASACVSSSAHLTRTHVVASSDGGPSAAPRRGSSCSPVFGMGCGVCACVGTQASPIFHGQTVHACAFRGNPH